MIRRRPRCKCGARIVQNDGHYICEQYLEDLRNMIHDLENDDQEEDYSNY